MPGVKVRDTAERETPANCATCSALTKRMRSFFGVLPPFTGPSFIGFQLLVVSTSRMTGGRGSKKFLLWE
ncbi:hypothetical protein [Rhizobium laguerreae]|uniref:hypothetical protein n=1 Tax=Rhizobium laguerreae TaxID=1076926 RepID=UPI0028C3B49E|nr:hypothetical protein [Rhizobium laguerreae]